MRKSKTQYFVDKLSMADERKEVTFGLYAVRFPRTKGRSECYYGPFVAKDDNVALASMCEISKSEPVFQRKNIYCVGTYCSMDAKIVACKPRLVLGKVN